MNDRELMRWSKVDDADASWQVAQRRRAMVFRVVRGIVGCEDDPEDVVQ